MASIIAEFCQNHKGDRKILKDMIWSASESGAEYGKIQTIFSGDLVFRERFEEGIVENGEPKAIKRPFLKEYERLRPMDLRSDDYIWFIEECGKAGIKPLTTVFTRGRIPFMANLPWKDVKVASYDCASYPLLQELSQHFSHLFVSTGATYDEEIEQAAKVLDGKSFSFLHCVTIYPTPLDQVHLNRMNWLRKFSSSVGFSDHSLVSRDGIKASLAALALGADVIERHYTILPPEESKDGPVSITSKLLEELVKFSKLPEKDRVEWARREIPEFETMKGQETRPLTHEEKLNRDYYRGRFASRIFNWENTPADV